jgi:ferredoxin--NADP+ reductase
MVSTGSGIAPFMAMLRNKIIWERFDRVNLLHGMRHLETAAYHIELSRLAAKRPGQFSYQPCTSQSLTPAGVLPGRVTDHLTELAAKLPPTSHWLLCGVPGMVAESQVQLEQLGWSRLKERSIHCEAF